MPTWAGMAFTAFVTDVCSRRIVGWRTASRMPTELPLDALEMALWTRAREGVTDLGNGVQGTVPRMPSRRTDCDWPRSSMAFHQIPIVWFTD